jgi:hypothetical protein
VKIKFLTVAIILALSAAMVAAGQVPGGSSARDVEIGTQKIDPRVEQVLERANDHFRKGKLDLVDNKREQARDEFNKAIDEILMSGLDVRASQRLQTGYLELVEKIYREEVPLIRAASQQDITKPASKLQIGFREQSSKSEQERCAIGIDRVPAIRGLRLGMTISEVKALYPSISEPNDRDELGRSMIMVRGADGNDRLKGIDYLSLWIFNGRVFSISVSFKEQSYPEVDDLSKLVSLAKNEDYATAYCEGFNATVFRHSDSQTLDLMDTLALNKIVALSNEMKEKSADCQGSPTVRGIGLGMALTKFRTLFPRSREVRNRSEVGELILHDINAGNARLNGVTDLWLYFLDGKLYFFAIDYSNQIQWKSLDQFVEQFSRGLGLRTKWEGFEFTGTRTLLCHSFAAVAEIKDGHPRIAIQDRAAAAKLSQREERLKSPASFRPEEPDQEFGI